MCLTKPYTSHIYRQSLISSLKPLFNIVRRWFKKKIIKPQNIMLKYYKVGSSDDYYKSCLFMLHRRHSQFAIPMLIFIISRRISTFLKNFPCKLCTNEQCMTTCWRRNAWAEGIGGVWLWRILLRGVVSSRCEPRG